MPDAVASSTSSQAGRNATSEPPAATPGSAAIPSAAATTMAPVRTIRIPASSRLPSIGGSRGGPRDALPPKGRHPRYSTRSRRAQDRPSVTPAAGAPRPEGPGAPAARAPRPATRGAQPTPTLRGLSSHHPPGLTQRPHTGLVPFVGSVDRERVVASAVPPDGW